MSKGMQVVIVEGIKASQESIILEISIWVLWRLRTPLRKQGIGDKQGIGKSLDHMKGFKMPLYPQQHEEWLGRHLLGDTSELQGFEKEEETWPKHRIGKASLQVCTPKPHRADQPALPFPGDRVKHAFLCVPFSPLKQSFNGTS